jgi:hypothetical protein
MIAPIGPKPAVSTEICARDHELRKAGRFRARVTDDAVSGEQRANSSAGVVFSAAAILAKDAIEGDT